MGCPSHAWRAGLELRENKHTHTLITKHGNKCVCRTLWPLWAESEWFFLGNKGKVAQRRQEFLKRKQDFSKLRQELGFPVQHKKRPWKVIPHQYLYCYLENYALCDSVLCHRWEARMNFPQNQCLWKVCHLNFEPKQTFFFIVGPQMFFECFDLKKLLSLTF